MQGGLLVGLDGRRPLAWFLAGRLVAYSLAGALLGLLGTAVSLPPRARAVLLVAAGVLVIFFAIRLLRRPSGDCAASARPPSKLGAPLLGAATILVPCGVTLGMEMIAVSSGSPLGGAAVMAGFVLGTTPAFALLGYLLGRVSRTRLARVAGALAIAAGLWTVGIGVNLGVSSGFAGSTPPAAGTPAQGASTVTVWATRDGYRPAIASAPAGVPVELIFKVADRGCTTTLTIDGRDLALPATVKLPPQPPGRLRYACGMGMYSGFINFS